ncbi:MAG: hypothetical protein E6R05_02020 [Candidatus Moraniibacteriota bacterium]|nr:MAG: hypothetical protein E6R05_02020 [Candidatus Moranbacteria bacterium]
MNFDDTELVIRQRSMSDLFDMTLRVWEKYNWRLITVFLLGCFPFAMLNMYLLGWMVTEDGLLSAELIDSAAWLTRTRYFYDYGMLVFLEMQIAGIFATALLGEVTFKQNPTTWQLVKSVAKRWGGILVVLGTLRFGILGPLIMLFLPRNGSYDPFIELFLLGIVATGISFLSRTFRPYAPEIVVLERCDLRPRDKTHPRYDKRSTWLHAPVSTESFARMVALIALNHVAIFCMLLAYLFVQGVLTNSWQWNWVVDWIVVPLIFWFLGAFATVFRFLGYLDSRISLEGWEVELLLRAEANRLTQEQGKGLAG